MHKEKFIDYSQLAIANAEGADDMINRVQTKDNIGIVCCLDIKEPSHGELWFSGNLLFELVPYR